VTIVLPILFDDGRITVHNLFEEKKKTSITIKQKEEKKRNIAQIYCKKYCIAYC